MATSLGHYLFGLSIAQSVARDAHAKKQAFWLAAVACLPDLDVVPGIMVGQLNRFHHGFSHSFTAAIIFALGVGLLFKWWIGKRSLKFGALCFLLYSSHVILDFLSLDTGVVRGVPLFWPWSAQTYQSPWVLLPNVQHSSGPLVSIHNLLVMFRELFLFIPLVAFVHALKTPRWQLPEARIWLYGTWFFAAVWASIISVSS